MTTKPVSVQEEVEAALLEGTAPLPEELVELRKEYLDINEMIAELEARKTVIKTTVGLHADMSGVSMFTVNNVNAMGFNPRTTVTVDKKQLMNQYPEVFDELSSSSTTQVFFCK